MAQHSFRSMIRAENTRTGNNKSLQSCVIKCLVLAAVLSLAAVLWHLTVTGGLVTPPRGGKTSSLKFKGPAVPYEGVRTWHQTTVGAEQHRTWTPNQLRNKEQKQGIAMATVGLLVHPRDRGGLEALLAAAEQRFGRRMIVSSVGTLEDNSNSQERAMDSASILKSKHSLHLQGCNEEEFSDSETVRRFSRKNKKKKASLFNNVTRLNIDSWPSSAPRVLIGRNNGSVASVMNVFDLMYSRKVRYFYLSQDYRVTKQLQAHIKKRNVDKEVQIVTPFTNVNKTRVNFISISSPYSMLIESLIDGRPRGTFFPIITEQQLRIMPTIDLVLQSRGHQTLPPWIIPNNGTVQNKILVGIIEYLEDNICGKSNFSVILSIGGELKNFVLATRGRNLGKGRVLVHSHPNHLDAVWDDKLARQQASQLEMITSLALWTHSNRSRQVLPYLPGPLAEHLNETEFLAADILLQLMADQMHSTHEFPNNEENQKTLLYLSGQITNTKILRLVLKPVQSLQHLTSPEPVWAISSELKIQFRSTSDVISFRSNITHSKYLMTKIESIVPCLKTECANTPVKQFNQMIGELRGDSSIYLKCNITLPIEVKEVSYSHRTEYNSNSTSKTSTLRCTQKVNNSNLITCSCMNGSRVTVKSREKRSYYSQPGWHEFQLYRDSPAFQRQYYGQVYKRSRQHHRRRNFPPQFTRRVRLMNLIAVLPETLNCFGSTFGCVFCYLFVFYTNVDIGPGACMGACGVAVGGSCGVVLGKGVQRMGDQTVICTELHRQGLMSELAYRADANFGRQLEKQQPKAMFMYRKMAAPIVRLMGKSKRFTLLVNYLATPFKEHMEFSESLRDKDNEFGKRLFDVTCRLLTLMYDIWSFIDLVPNLEIIILTLFTLKTLKSVLT